jgi:uncharacterized protein YbjT (DUF2867 family)
LPSDSLNPVTDSRTADLPGGVARPSEVELQLSALVVTRPFELVVPRREESGQTAGHGAAKLTETPWYDDAEVVTGDLADADSVRAALDGQEIVDYLVHSLQQKDFVRRDRELARTLAEAARQQGVKRNVYLGGITPDDEELSPHLASRQEVEEILLASGVPTVVLRVAIIIGSGSASFEMLRYLTERLPVMITPRWVHNRIQPIAVRDVLHYLTRAARLPADVNRGFDIGGPDVLTYLDMMRRYAVVAKLSRRVVVPVPVLTPWLSAQRANLVTPVPKNIAVPLIESLVHEVVAADATSPRMSPTRPTGSPTTSVRSSWRTPGSGTPTCRPAGPTRARRQTRCRPTRNGPAAASTPTPASSPPTPTRRHCGRSSRRSAVSTAGTRSRSRGRCVAGSTGSWAASALAAAAATRAGCTPVRHSTGGGSS